MPDSFWKDFQNALRARDSEKIAGMTHFPADIGLAEIEGFEGINQREGFVRHFDTIFPKEAVETLLAKSASDLELQRFDHAGEAEYYWFVQHDHKDPLASEGDWNIRYVFSRQPDGSIQLTGVGFAG